MPPFAANLFLDHPEIPLPLRVVKARRGHGSCLTIDLTDPDSSEPADAPPKWHIWVYLCDWVLQEGGTEILNSDCTDDAAYERALAKLPNATLHSANTLDDNERCELLFSNGMQLFLDDASDLYGSDSEMFMIFHDNKFLTRFKPRLGLSP